MTASALFNFRPLESRKWDDLATIEESSGIRKTNSGKPVSEQIALQNSVVWASVGLIVDSVSTLRPRAVTENEDGSVSKVSLPKWVRSPHPQLRRADVWAQLLSSAILWGNGYALIIRGGNGAPLALIPLDPRRVHCDWVDPLQKIYRYYQIDGGRQLTEADVLHIQGFTLPGQPTGLSMIGQAREAIGLGLTLEEFGARYFAQGSLSKVVLKLPAKGLTEQEAREIVANYERFHRGAGNWHRPAVASGGTEVQNVSIPPDDAQFLESREFQAEDIARWFRVPPHRVGIVSKQSSWGSGLAEENTAVTMYTFRPWIQRLESAFTFYTAGPEDRGVLIQLDDSDLQRGSFDETVNTWNVAITGGWVTPNEGRRQIGLEPIEGGDELLTPMQPMGQDPSQQNTDQNKSGGDPNGQDDPRASDASGGN